MFHYPLYYQYNVKELDKSDLWKLTMFGFVFIAGLFAFLGTVYFGWLNDFAPIIRYSVDIGIGVITIALSGFLLAHDFKSLNSIKIHAN